MNQPSPVRITSERCKACGLCIHFCPKNALTQGDENNAMGYYVVRLKDNSHCNKCGLCQIICPDVAITVLGKKSKPK
jgi:2-oxoglutarate ferredoxin oxidoreductase subunit delta